MSKTVLSVAVLLFCVATVAQANVEAHAMPNLREQVHSEVVKLGLTADVTATLEESLFQKVCAAVLPLINGYGQNLVIPGENQKHFSFSNFAIQNFHVAGLSITFSAPNVISVTITGLQFTVPHTEFHVFTKIIFKISCSGDFWASLGSTNIVLTLPVSESGGKLVFGTPTTNVQWGSLNIGHKMHGVVCKVGANIVQAFIGNIDKLIKKVVQKDLPSKMGPPIQSALNAAMQKVPLDIVSAPAVTANSISVTVDLLGSSGAGVRSVGPFRGHQVRPRALPPRDVFLQIPAASADNIMTVCQQQGHFNGNMTTDPKFNTSLLQTIFPSVYQQCPGCPFSVGIVFPSAPVVSAGSDSVALQIANTVFGLNIVKANSPAVPLFELFVTSTLEVTGLTVNAANKVYFQLALETLNFSVDQSSIGPIIPAQIAAFVKQLMLDEVVPSFNQRFQGIGLPPAIQQAEIDVENGILYFGFNAAL